MSCKKCSDILNPVSPDLIVGINKILIVGESPKGELSKCLQSPTFKKLAKNLQEVGINLFDCSFTEICKCKLKNRSDFEVIGKKCIPKLLKQIEQLNPSLVITLGVISNKVFASEYNIVPGIGNLVTINNFLYLPLWHTSPINPQGFKRNQEILKTIKVYLPGV